jgi:hypothetical protein
MALMPEKRCYISSNATAASRLIVGDLENANEQIDKREG